MEQVLSFIKPSHANFWYHHKTHLGAMLGAKTETHSDSTKNVVYQKIGLGTKNFLYIQAKKIYIRIIYEYRFIFCLGVKKIFGT